MFTHPGRDSDLGSGLTAQLPKASRWQEMDPRLFRASMTAVAVVVGQPLSFGQAAEGSDRVELCFHVLLLGFCNFLHAKDGY